MLDKKRYAEVLIKECARVAGDAEENEKEQRSMFYVITEHFGVE